MTTKLGKVLTHYEKPPTFDHVTNMTLTRFIATKLGRVLTSGKMFRTQTLKLSPTSYYFFECVHRDGQKW